jgi:predicted HD superfamily hydrolase involved in NAD metabolism
VSRGAHGVAAAKSPDYTFRDVKPTVSYQDLLDQLERSLPPRRFLHVLGVTHTAVQLAARHGVDCDLAAQAGLIHDRSKALSPEAIEDDLRARGIEIPEEDRAYPAIWHGLHAAVWLRQESGWEDFEALEAVAQAVEHHSTGDPALGRVGRVLFIADFLEPGRFFDGIDELRTKARDNLDAGYESCLAAKCRHVIEKKQQRLHPRAQRALEACGIEIAREAPVAPDA